MNGNDRLAEIVDILLAFQLLEHRDKNLLSGDSCEISTVKIEMLEEARQILKNEQVFINAEKRPGVIPLGKAT